MNFTPIQTPNKSDLFKIVEIISYFSGLNPGYSMDPILNQKLKILEESLEGELRFDSITRTIYSTDASAYKEMPVATAWPFGTEDIRKVLKFSVSEKIPITVRGAGTSLAGQVVSSGIILDISRHMNNILEINHQDSWVKVQPGVVLDELNKALKKHGLFFGPETSTSNRCNIGGMVGNNACGLHSLVHGSTRDHTISLKAILSDGSEAIFEPVDTREFELKCELDTLEGKLYRNIKEILSDQENQRSIIDEYPDPSVTRRNTGYALDSLLDSKIFNDNSGRLFNFSNLITGSEGTLAIVTEIKLNLIPLTPANKALVCIHLNKRNESFHANLIALKYKPSAVELMDDRILKLTEQNITQRKNRFFVEGDPGAILIVEFTGEKMAEIEEAIIMMIKDLKASGYGYSYPVIRGSDISKVWELRKAGLGVLSNMIGDAKPVSLIEDTAVNVKVLPDFMEELEKMLISYGKDSVFHAHIATGELHIRPVLNLKDPEDVKLFRKIGEETARLVKKYRGSLSGEHGDGRLRGEFIPIVIGERNYGLLKEVKQCWDPENILNPGKITNTAPMDTSLRYSPGAETPLIPTYYSFESTLGVIRAAENCNGSGDCRKSEMAGGTMCPSYMATRDEKNTTRARANILREYLWKPGKNRWDHKEIYEVLDLCLSCKGCKSECPSNVDIAKMKSEFLQHWYEKHGIPLRTLVIGYLPAINAIGSLFPAIYNFVLKNKITSGILKRVTGFARERSIPILYRTTLRRWINRNLETIKPNDPKGTVCLFIDEFTNFNDTETGIKAVKLLTGLKYKVITVSHSSSGRTFISKGLLKRAKKVVRKNISRLHPVINENLPLIGIEPSALLSFRDEYPDLCGDDLRQAAMELSANCFLIDEFIVHEYKAGRISRSDFSDLKMDIILHTHCQQKSIAGSSSLIEALSIPINFRIKEIPSGCCGMAGSFGYEKEHYELSNKIGELVLFPELRKAGEDTVAIASGTSCRHHIKDGTGIQAIHPVEALYEALNAAK